MANVIYTKLFERMGTANLNWDTAVIRCAAERDTSTYTVDKDHDFMGDTTGFIEITAAGYTRQTTAGTLVVDDANDRVELDVADISFGASVTAGQTCDQLIFYIQTGGDDSTPADDPLICRIDTATGLPAATGGGAFNVTIDAQGLIQLLQP